MDQTFDARLAELSTMVEAVSAAATGAGTPPRRIPNLELAVEEILVNVIRHAYREQGGPIRVVTASAPGRFEVRLCDQGPAYNPLDRPPPDIHLPLEHRSPGGLGIHLVRKMTDDVSYRRESDWNVLTLGIAWNLAP